MEESTQRGAADPGSDCSRATAAIDLEGVFEEAVTLSSNLDRAWSEALTQIDAEPPSEDLTARWSVALRTLMAAINEREGRYVAAGRDVRLDHWPPNADDIAALENDPEQPEDQRRQLEQAQILAIELIVKRMGSLTAAMEGSQVAGPNLWQSGAFAAVRGHAALAMRITRELDAVDDVVLMGEEPAEHELMRRRAVEAALRALEHGDPEAALLHCLRAARATVASLSLPAEEPNPGLGASPNAEEASMTVGMFRLAEQVVCGEAAGRPANDGVSLVLAHALLPATAALVSSPSIEELVGLRAAWSAKDGEGS